MTHDATPAPATAETDPATSPEPGPEMGDAPPAGRLRQTLNNYAVSIVAALVFFAIWQAIVVVLKVLAFLVPTPTSIVVSLVAGFTEAGYLYHGLITIAEALIGFFAGTALGLLIGVAMVISPTLEKIVYPYVVALQSLPKVAIAPLLVVWFGFGLSSKVIVVATVALFPVLVNVMAGLKAVDQERLDLMIGLSATRWQVMRYLRFPNALPFIFAGLNAAIVFSVTMAIVGEFVGATQGLGFLILQANYSLDIAGAFALFVVLAVVGVALHAVVQFIASRVVFWSKPQDLQH